MVTDAPPRKNRAEFLESDRAKSLDVPQNGTLLEISTRLGDEVGQDCRRSEQLRGVFGDGGRFL
jgi:hypothetical protein